MARIRVISEHEDGSPYSERIYSLSGDCDDLDQIEASVEQFKRSALPDIEHSLLVDAQRRQLEGEKNSGPAAKRSRSAKDQDDAR